MVNMKSPQVNFAHLSKQFWMKDENATECFLCSKPFTAWRRKHHCRICGQIFCSYCTSLISGKRFNYKGNRMRVCKSCLKMLESYDEEDTSSSENSINDENSLLEDFGTVTNNANNINLYNNNLYNNNLYNNLHNNDQETDKFISFNSDTSHRLLLPSSLSVSSSLDINTTNTNNNTNINSTNSTTTTNNISNNIINNNNNNNIVKQNNKRHRLARSRRSRSHSDSAGLAPFLQLDNDDDINPLVSIEDSDSDVENSLNSNCRSPQNSSNSPRISPNSTTISTTTTNSSNNKILNNINNNNNNNNNNTLNAQSVDGLITKSKYLAFPNNVSRSKSSMKHFNDLDVFKTQNFSSSQSPNRYIRISNYKIVKPLIEMNTASLTHFDNLLRQLLQITSLSNTEIWEIPLTNAISEAVDTIDLDEKHNETMDIRNYVKFKRIPGSVPKNTVYFQGLVFAKNLALKSMPRFVTNPNIALLSFPIEYNKGDQFFMSLEPILAQEHEYLQNLVNRISSLGTTVIISSKGINNSALSMFCAAKIVVISNVKDSALHALSRCCEADIISSIDKLAMNPKLGYCQNLEVKTYLYGNIKKTFIFVGGTNKELGCTIILRGASMEDLADIKCVSNFMLYTAYSLRLETCLVRDEFLLIPSSVDELNKKISKSVKDEYENKNECEDKSESENKNEKQKHNMIQNEVEIYNEKQKQMKKQMQNSEDNLIKVQNQEKIMIEKEENEKTKTDLEKEKENELNIIKDYSEYYDDLVQVKNNTIFSTSPFILIPNPYLLDAAREMDSEVIKLYKKKDLFTDDSETYYFNKSLSSLLNMLFKDSEKEFISKITYNLIKDTMMGHYQFSLFNANFYQKQWEVFLAQSPSLYNPFSHQNIVLLYSIVSTSSGTPCTGPDLLEIEYYGESDLTLGQYIEHLCLTSNSLCADSCGNEMINHFRSYVHGNGQLNVEVSKVECKLPGLQDSILMWSYCLKCEATMPILPMSENSWKYSFGKYLELSFWNAPLSLRAGACVHNYFRDHIRYFGFNNLAVTFKYETINLFEIVVPRIKLFWEPELQVNLRCKLYLQVLEKIDLYWESLISRLSNINTDALPTNKLEECKLKIENMLARAGEEKKRGRKILQDLFTSTKYTNYISLNIVIRNLQEVVVAWDLEFSEFEKFYFPSERDIAKITATQLKKIFLDREASSITSAEEPLELQSSTQQSESTSGADKEQNQEHTNGENENDNTGKNSFVLNSDTETGEGSEELNDDDENLISKFKKSKEPTINGGGSENENRQESDTINNLKPKELPETVPTDKLVARLAKRFQENGIIVKPEDQKKLSKSKGNSGTSLSDDSDSSSLKQIQPNYKLMRLGKTKVSSLAQHFDQLSKEFEAQQLRKRTNLDASRSRAVPASSYKPIVEVFKDAKHAIEEEYSSDYEPDKDNFSVDKKKFGKNPYSMTSEEDGKKITKIKNGENQKEGEGDKRNLIGESKISTEDDSNERNREFLYNDADSLGSISENESRIESNEKMPITEPHSAEKVSIMRALTNFWADRSYSGWKELEYPLSMTEHIFVDSEVIVREEEPSSLIAFCLDSSDYKDKIKAIREFNEINDNIDNSDTSAEELLRQRLEKSLVKKTGTHLKYQFEEGSARFSCKIFYSEQFDAFRRQCECESEFIQSLSRCAPWDSSGGKSGSSFLKTLDDRLIVKQLSQAEVDAFLTFAPSYFEYMAQAFFHDLPTVIAKVLGFYQIQVRNSATNKSLKLDVLVMENLFYGRNAFRIFDLKGSMRNRHVQQTGKANEVLLDENMVEYMYDSPLFVREHAKKLLRASLWNDTLFLSKVNVMDYSLVVAIEPDTHQLVVGIIDFIRTYTWDKKLESWVKEKGLVGGGNKEPTVVTPRQYKNRFREAMERYILMVPDFWYQGNA